MSLVGFSARNHPQQAVRDRVDDRGTLPELFDPLNARHRFTLDAAASDDNHLCPKYYTRETDGLLRSWAGERVWCNPPYSRLEPWLAKAWGEMGSGCDLVVMLLPANRCEQDWWQTWVEPFRDGHGGGARRSSSDALREGALSVPNARRLRVGHEQKEGRPAAIRLCDSDFHARGL